MKLFDADKIYNFTNQTFVVTGATGVLCGVIARALNERGANVAVLARNLEKASAQLADFPHPERAAAFSADVLNKESLQTANEAILRRWGTIDGLVNGAGGNRPQATTGAEQTFFDLPESALREVVDLNVLGTILPSQIFARTMAQHGAGTILNISSMAAQRPLTRVVGYAAAKAAVDNFTRWLAVHLAAEYSPAVRVNAVAPGFFLSEQNRNLLIDSATGELTARGKSILAHTPMNRFGNAEDLIGAALWLLSPAAQFVTGVVIPVDGGFSAFSGV